MSAIEEESALIAVPEGFSKKIPLWMTKERAECFRIAKDAEICLKALLSLTELFDCFEEDESS